VEVGRHKGAREEGREWRKERDFALCFGRARKEGEEEGEEGKERGGSLNLISCVRQTQGSPSEATTTEESSFLVSTGIFFLPL
jgi:hypothetical protein